MSSIIPVLDVRNGQVVLAVRGERAHYQPLQSVLTQATDALTVVRDLYALHPFPCVYCADLDAIEGGVWQQRLWRTLCRRHPQVTFWLDAGPPPLATLPANCRLIAGTECLRHATPPRAETNLSLDFDADGLRGKPPVRACWKREVIVLSLHRVGAGDGPDWARLQAVRRQFPQASLVAGGGVRDAHDMRRIRAMRMRALVGSSLHNGRLPLYRWHD